MCPFRNESEAMNISGAAGIDLNVYTRVRIRYKRKTFLRLSRYICELSSSASQYLFKLDSFLSCLQMDTGDV